MVSILDDLLDVPFAGECIFVVIDLSIDLIAIQERIAKIYISKTRSIIQLMVKEKVVSLDTYDDYDGLNYEGLDYE